MFVLEGAEGVVGMGQGRGVALAVEVESVLVAQFLAHISSFLRTTNHGMRLYYVY